MNKEFFRKNKKVFFISLVVVFVGLMFLLKSNSVVNNKSSNQSGLIYSGETFNELVNRDTDGDGIMDWEESLWGTDPTKTDSNNNGIGDAAEIAKMKQSTGATSNPSLGQEGDENLSETAKFSRELFTTVSALNQTGTLDQNTIDNLSTTLSQKIISPVVKKTYILSDLKVVKTSTDSIKAYKLGIITLTKKYPTTQKQGVATVVAVKVADTLKKYLANGEDAEVFSELDPITKDINSFMDGMIKMNVPEEFSLLHLDLLNSLNRIEETLLAIKKVDTDPIVTIGLVGKFMENLDSLQNASSKLTITLNKK